MFYSNANFNINFSGRPNINKDLVKTRDCFNKFFSGIQSPTKLRLETNSTIFDCNENIYELDAKLLQARLMMDYSTENSTSYFQSLISIIKYFRVGNCHEFAEIVKTILNINGIKKCGLYQVYAKDKNGNMRQIDHIVTVLGLKAHKNKSILLEPRDKTKIIDLWADNYIGTIGKAKKKYAKLGINTDDKILLKQIDTPRIDKPCINYLRKMFPGLIFKKK